MLKTILDRVRAVLCGGLSVLSGLEDALGLLRGTPPRICVFVPTDEAWGRNDLLRVLGERGLLETVTIAERHDTLEEILDKLAKANFVIVVGGNGQEWQHRLKASPDLARLLMTTFLDPGKVILGTSLGFIMWFRRYITADLVDGGSADMYVDVEALGILPGIASAHYKGRTRLETRVEGLHRIGRELRSGEFLIGIEDGPTADDGARIVIDDGCITAYTDKYDARVERIVVGDGELYISDVPPGKTIPVQQFWDPDWRLAA